MNDRINSDMLEEFAAELRAEEKSQTTIKKYIRDVRGFIATARDEKILSVQILELR